MTYDAINVGLRVYNRGDMANPEHWGTVTRVVPPGRFGAEVEITPDAGEGRKAYFVPPCAISEVDKGHCGTHIVTAAAYEERRQEQIAAFVARCSKA